MKWLSWIGGILLIVMLIGSIYFLRNLSTSNNDQSGGTSQTSSTLSIGRSYNGRTLTYPVGYELTIKADSTGWALDISGYDKKIITQLGTTEQFQLQRTIKMLKAGQTELTIVITPGCAIPKDGQLQCMLASQQIKLTIIVK